MTSPICTVTEAMTAVTNDGICLSITLHENAGFQFVLPPALALTVADGLIKALMFEAVAPACELKGVQE